MVKVVTDSSCDIPVEVARKLPITIVPLYIQFGGKTYRDGIDLNIDRFYYELAHGQDVPKTSVPSPGDFLEVYNKLAVETDQIISIHLSPRYSGTFNVAILAKDYVGDRYRVEVIDSNSVSVGLGLIVIEAAKAAQEVKNLDQIVDIVRGMIPRTRIFGKIESFPPLFKGKRFRLTKGLTLLGKVSTVLNTKLLGELYDGGKIRSPMLAFGQTMALNRLKRWAESFVSIERMAIVYSTTPDEAEMLVERLEPLFPREHMLITRLGCVTSTYIGLGVLAMALIGIKKR